MRDRRGGHGGGHGRAQRFLTIVQQGRHGLGGRDLDLPRGDQDNLGRGGLLLESADLPAVLVVTVEGIGQLGRLVDGGVDVGDGAVVGRGQA